MNMQEQILETVTKPYVPTRGELEARASKFHGAIETTAFLYIEEKIRRNTALLINKARSEGISMREAAMGLATERIWNAQRTRGWK